MIEKIIVAIFIFLFVAVIKHLLGVEIAGGTLEVFIYMTLYGVSLIVVSRMFDRDR